MPTAWGYGRVSGDQQAESGLSEGEQAAVCRLAYDDRMAAKGFGWGGFHFDAGVSAGKVLFFDRRAAGDLWRQTRTGDVVIVAKQDRLIRRTYDWAQVVHQFQKRGVLLAIENMGTANGEVVRMDPYNPFNKAMLGMAAVFAELELDQIRERNQMRVRRSRALGRMTSGRPPYGFVGHEIAKCQYLVPAVQQRLTARWMVAMRDVGHGVQRIADELNERGHRVEFVRKPTRHERPRFTTPGLFARSTVSERMSAERALQRAESEFTVDWKHIVYIHGPGGVRVSELDKVRRGLYLGAGQAFAEADQRRLRAAETAIAPDAGPG